MSRIIDPAAATPARWRPSALAVGRARSTFRVLLRTVVVFLTVFFLATVITFALQDLSGLSPAYLQLSESATPEQVAALESQWGMDRPVYVQYADWLSGMLTGDLGYSWFNNVDISALLGPRIAISLSVAGLALVVGVVLGVALGTVAAVFQTTWLDRGITAFTTFISVMPPFVVGIGLVAIFAVELGWFPAVGYVSIADGGVGGWLQHLWLPALALSFDTVADVARQLRVGLIQAYRENYVAGAIVRGLGPRRIFFGHVLRNASGPTVAILGLKFPALLGGAVVTEAIFGLNGFGQFAASSATRGDVPAVQAVLVCAVVLVVVFNLAVNVVLARFFPASARGF